MTTYKEMIDMVMAYFGGDTSNMAIQRARQGVQMALKSIGNMRRWSYYFRRYPLVTNAAQTTGSVTYDHCVTPEHEALTRDGWKTYDQLKVGDDILSYDHDLEVCSWQPIQELHIMPYKGEIMEVVRKKRAVLRCTPNHRFPVFERHGGNKARKYQLRKRWVTAKELTYDQTVPCSAPIDIESTSEEACRMAAILGWTVTDGHGLFTTRDQVGISQSTVANPEKCSEIMRLVGRDGWNGGPGKKVFGLFPQDKHLLRRLVKSKDDLPRHFCTFGVQEAESAAYAMIQAEASTNINGQKVFTQWGNNKPVAEAFQIACVLSGRACNISQRTYGGKTRYQLPVRTTNRMKMAKQSRWVPYDGTVWCPQVRTGAWVVRCNGAVTITGNSGGAYERMLTVADTTWPTWATYGMVRIGNVSYEVAEYKTTTIITLTENSNPGADVAAGTAYSLYRDSYPLPTDFLNLDTPNVSDNVGGLGYVHPNEWLNAGQSNQSQGTPNLYTIMGDPNYMGALAIFFYPPPDSAYTVPTMYNRAPRPLILDEYSTGTATTSSTTVTGIGTAWTSNMAGAMIRFSSGTLNVPTGLSGPYPYYMERTVMSVESATSLTIDSTPGETLTGVKYSISDPVDIADYMVDLFRLECFKQARLGYRLPPHPEEVNEYDRSRNRAFETDAVSAAPRAEGYSTYRRPWLSDAVTSSSIT